jgi:hypothetical protein
MDSYKIHRGRYPPSIHSRNTASPTPVNTS